MIMIELRMRRVNLFERRGMGGGVFERKERGDSVMFLDYPYARRGWAMPATRAGENPVPNIFEPAIHQEENFRSSSFGDLFCHTGYTSVVVLVV